MCINALCYTFPLQESSRSAGANVAQPHSCRQNPVGGFQLNSLLLPLLLRQRRFSAPLRVYLEQTSTVLTSQGENCVGDKYFHVIHIENYKFICIYEYLYNML